MTASCRSCASCERELSAVRLAWQQTKRERDQLQDALLVADHAREDALAERDEAICAREIAGKLAADGIIRDRDALRAARKERDQYRDALREIVSLSDEDKHGNSDDVVGGYWAAIDAARAALSRERKDTP